MAGQVVRRSYRVAPYDKPSHKEAAKNSRSKVDQVHDSKQARPTMLSHIRHIAAPSHHSVTRDVLPG
jgi:hypothetical protein